MTLWPAPPAVPLLPPGEVHLWRFPLDSSPDDRTTLKALLSADEVQRAARLLDPHKAQAFIAGRGRLRQLLGAYRQCDPAALNFVYGGNGKPALAGSPLQFNLAHSGDWGVLALSASAAVGVDIEKIDPTLDYARLAKRFFSAAESEILSAAPGHRQRRSFYRLWTRKEALLKGAGQGFSLSEGTEERDWQERSFWLASGYVGSVAWAAAITSIQRFSMRSDWK